MPFEGTPASLGPGLRTANGVTEARRILAVAYPAVSSSEISLEQRKLMLATAVARGASISGWAKANEVPKRTAYRWASDPQVRAKVTRSRQRALDRAIGLMSKNAHWAAGGIRTLAESASSESVKLSALRTIFTNMMAVSEFADLQDRMSQLEEQLDERARAGDTGQAG